MLMLLATATVTLMNAAPDYPAHVAAQKKRYGAGVEDLDVVIEPPFVVWGDTGPVQLQRSATQLVRWTAVHLEKQFFTVRPDGIYDIFLFKDPQSYRRHAKALWNDEPDTPFGYASAFNHALVMDISTGGGTLVHEMVHPYLAANFPEVPTWFNEGLASLFEQSAERDGEIVGLTNWRLAGLKEAYRKKKVKPCCAGGAAGLKPFAQLVTWTDAQFRDGDEAEHYAQARYLMLYLQERGLLQKFVKRALEQQKKDPTAATALKETLGPAEWKALDERFKQWVATLEFP